MVQPPIDEADIFQIARELRAPEARANYLRQACGDDAELHDRIVALLRIAEEEQSFLEHPAADFAVTVNQPLPEAAGTVIGSYKLLEQIGEGGFGIVYMADQQAPVRRRVALKIIKPGMDTKQVLARFNAELQALSLMDHPSIARALDAGATDAGRPYFVMELVRGVPITDYCDQNNLAVHERLDLFVQVCHAVQHAHQKGIIHRDIKPSNVLVTMHDGRAVPKVIDFGVAKAINQQLTQETIFTRFAEMIGTPLYMSPEQAEMTSLDIDTRSDIYSLGVLLYELLTGSTPFDKELLKRAAYDEIRRIIREEEPAKPSTRISTLGDNSAIVAAHRHADPRRLGQLMRGDLDWIVMKALEKDRTRRYETANGLAMDIQRHLADEPVIAGPPSAAYRFRKFARRNRAALAMVAVVTVALLLGIVGTTWQAIQATRERDRAVTAEALAQTRFEAETVARAAEAEQRQIAEAQRAEAEKMRLQAEANFRKARQAVDEYFTLVSESKLFDVPGLQPLRKQLLEAALRYYQGFLDQRSSDPNVRTELAATYLRVAHIYEQISHSDDSILALQQGLDVVEKLLQQNPPLADLPKQLAGVRKGGRISHMWETWPSDTAGAVRTYQKAAELWERLAGANPEVNALQSDLAAFYWRIGDLEWASRAYAAALPAFQRACQIWEKLAHEKPNVSEYRADLAESLDHVGKVLMGTGRNAESEATYRQSLAIREELVAEFPNLPDYRAGLANSFRRLGSALRTFGRPEEAEKAWRKSIELWEKLSAEFPNFPAYRKLLAAVQVSLGTLLKETGRPQEAAEAYRRGIEIQGKLAAEFPANEGDSITNFTDSLLLLADLLAQSGRREEAEKFYRQAIESYEKHVAAFPQPGGRTKVYLSLAQLLVASNRPREADEAYRKALEFAPKDAAALNNLAWPLAISPDPKLRDPVSAVKLAQKAVELAPTAGHIWNTLGVAQYRTGDWKAAIAALEKSMEFRQGGDSADWFFVAMAHWQLGEKDLAQKWYQAAALWMARQAPNNEEFKRFRAEAATLIGLPETGPADATDELAVAEILVEVYPRPSSYLFRGGALADSNQWARAADNYTKAIKLGEKSYFPWYTLALLRRAQDNKPAYQAACADMLKQFAQTEDGTTTSFVAWSCALGPDGLTDFAPAIALAERATRIDAKSSQFANSRGAILYRAGRFDEALRTLEDAERLAGTTDPGRSSLAYTWYLLAMTQHRLGHADDAKKWFDKAREQTDQALHDHDSGTTKLGWNRRLTLNLLRHEAEELLGVKPKPAPEAKKEDKPATEKTKP